ncbi:heme NO-binding domain-containing protein [Pontibacter sp. MBLB2868]|uniref:heme NO-binding domain-containing protein n=1 Tax=Pontibacter sp. MBLB2868 TaxID=3451555 RepID=UPI003F754652
MKADHMHGSLFVLLKRFVKRTYGYGTWVKLIENAGVEHGFFQMQELYPSHEIFAIMGCLAEMTNRPLSDVMEQYGEFIIPDLMLMYNKYVNPEWRTYQMLLHAEEAMHGAVRRADRSANPPRLLVIKKGANELIIDYHSERRMASVAVGIIRGIARYFDESDTVDIMHLTPVDAERVQIKVEFHN